MDKNGRYCLGCDLPSRRCEYSIEKDLAYRSKVDRLELLTREITYMSDKLLKDAKNSTMSIKL